MTKRITEYAIGDLARASGVTVRTLRHYDETGLLKPSHVALNGYRVYGEAEALRLQEILFYRSVGMGLAEIAETLDGTENPVERLSAHRQALAGEMVAAAERLALLDRTIAHLKGEADMALEELYKPFPPEKQAEYEAWLVETYGGDMAARIAESKVAVEKLPDGMEGAMADLKEIEAGLVALQAEGVEATSDATHDLLERHRALMARLWGRDCPPDGVEGLADMYQAHPDFVARYERLAPRFSQWLPDAMRAHAKRLRG